MCDKAVDNFPSRIKFVCECFMTQEMCVKNQLIISFCIWFYSWSK